MKEEKDYIQDISEIRTMMERSSKFLSLAGWAGIMAGLYALAGAWIAYDIFYFNPDEIIYGNLSAGTISAGVWQVIILALSILVLTLVTAIILSRNKATKKSERLWNATSRRLLINLGVPLVAGGVLILILISKGFIGFIAPFTLIFYGLALYNAGRFTYSEIQTLGLIEIVLGLISSYFVGYGLLFWALGFGVLHIIYGIYIHYKYER